MIETTTRPWHEPPELAINDDILELCKGDTLIAGILACRGMTDPDKVRAFLDPEAYSPAPPEAIPDLVKASEMLQKAVASGQKILIWGDFDVDGQTATALLIDGLRRLDAEVDYYIPNRSSESHGIKVNSLAEQFEARKPAVLLTCDTGVTEFEAIDYACSRGVPVIVTDHHDLAEGGRLPAADAVINPKRLPGEHPLAALPGVGVAYKVMQHLYTSLGRERELGRLLDLVALGIVGDIAEQVNDTRYLLQIGLERLRFTERIGLLALYEVAQITPDQMNAEKIGYQIGPRLNAAGRLADAQLAVELLTTRDRARAYVIAQQMEGLNVERRRLTGQIEGETQRLIEGDPALLDYEALVIYQPGWHSGIVGIVANRLAERYLRPAVVLTSGERAVAYGSARSFGGYDIVAALAAQADLLIKFGGHPGAAGLSLDASQIDTFRRRLSQTLVEMGGTVGPPPLQIDAMLTFDQIDETLIHRLERLAPFGEGNPTPLLATKSVHVSHAGIIGQDKQHLKLTLEDDRGQPQQMLWWGAAKRQLPAGRFDVAYEVSFSDRGEVQAVLIDLREIEEPVIEVVEEPKLRLEDWRRETEVASRLAQLQTEAPEALVWAEAFSRHEHPAWKRRAELTPAPALIIYTMPSDPATLEAALARVQPEVVHVFAVEPPLEGFEAFLRQLVVAARNVIERLGGMVALDVLCGAAAQSPQVVRAGLEYLEAEGQFTVEWLDADTVKLSAHKAGAKPDKHTLRPFLDKLRNAYEEVEAYRRFFRSLPLKKLFPQ